MFLAGYWYVEQVTNWSPPLFPIYTRCSMACWRTATFCSLDLITSSRFIICISKSDYSYANNLASQVVTMSNTAKCSFHFSRWNESHSGGSHYFCGAYMYYHLISGSVNKSHWWSELGTLSVGKYLASFPGSPLALFYILSGWGESLGTRLGSTIQFPITDLYFSISIRRSATRI